MSVGKQESHKVKSAYDNPQRVRCKKGNKRERVFEYKDWDKIFLQGNDTYKKKIFLKRPELVK